MGHSTSSGRTAAFSPEAERALNSEGSLVDRLNAYNRAMDEADRTRVMSARERQNAAPSGKSVQNVAKQNERLIKSRLKSGARFDVDGLEVNAVKNNRFYGGRRETDHTVYIRYGGNETRIGPGDWRTVRARALRALGL